MNMPLSVLNRRRRIGAASTPAFSPSTLFASSEPGVWYDPSDLTTLYQDTAGTTPVVTPGQTVALMLDKSKGLTLGTELVTNAADREFTSDTGYWTKQIPTNGAVTIGGGVCTISSIDGTLASISRASLTTTGIWYRLSLTVLVRSGGIRITDSTGAIYATITTSGSKSLTILAAGTGTLSLVRSGVTDADIDNISVRELPGNHATQATAASRPTYGVVPTGGRRNLLTWSEDFRSTAGAGEVRPWFHNNVTISANTTLSPTGTLTADTMTGTGGFPFCYQDITASVGSTVSGSFWIRKTSGLANGSLPTTSLEFRSNTTLAEYSLVLDTNNGAAIASSGWGTAPALNASMQSDGDYWRVSLSSPATPAATTAARLYIGVSGGFLNGTRPGSFPASSVIIWGAQLELGSTATAYQKVTTAFDVTEAGVQSLSYLSFDGVDDGMLTPSVGFNADKMTVFAGLRKANDATRGIVAETSAAAASGAWNLNAPNGTAIANYAFRNIGTSSADVVTSSTFAAPTTNVLTAIGDIAGDISQIRVNGSVAANSTNDLGSGNYAANILYIGRRGGATLPFSGNLYSLIVRNAATDATTITASESWVAGKTGVVL